MRANQNLVLQGHGAILVPYRQEHVLKYHEWMQDPALQEATASEPLSLQEEYDMQRCWEEDDKKCTFIVLDSAFRDTEGTGHHGGGMAGDVNLFWNDYDEPHTTEIEVMVAEERSRRKGLAHEALILLMAYALKELAVTKFRAKIGQQNRASQQLFTKLGFVEISRSEVFQEVTLELSAPPKGGDSQGAAPSWAALLGTELRRARYDPDRGEQLLTLDAGPL